MNRLLVAALLSFAFLACERERAEKISVVEPSVIAAPISAVERVQFHPAFESWSQVSHGMTEKHVIEILGKPKSGSPWDDYKSFPDSENAQYNWNYGSLYPESASDPAVSEFSVTFTQGLVVRKDDPFGGAAIKSSGVPTTPNLFLPEDKTMFDHFPRIIDLRWWASSGSVPITYEVSIEVKYPSGEWGVEDGLQKHVDGLHVAMSFPGSNQGRWRVRGMNKDGVGEWSEYRSFKFSR